MERKRIYLVGLGPGGREQMTQQAYAALADADVLCGYTGYVDLVRGWFPEKETNGLLICLRDAEKKIGIPLT